MPRIKSKQIIGENPTQPEHLTTKEYVDGLVSDIPNGITIIDEGVELLTNVNSINFVGGGITAQVDDLQNRRIIVYVPPVEYTSHFNTQDGNSNSMVIIPNNLSQRYVSLPTSEGNPYNIGDWNTSTITYTIKKNDLLTYTTNSPFGVTNSNTKLKTIVYDADGTTELTSSEITLDNNKSVTVNNVTYVVNNMSSDKNKYKLSVSVTVQISNILPNGGRFSIEIIHNNDIDGIYTFRQDDIFRDNGSSDITTSDLLLTVQTPYVFKTLSGVKFLTTESKYTVNLSDINNLNDSSYPTTEQLQIIGNNLGVSDILVNGEGGIYDVFSYNSWNQQYDINGVTYNKMNWEINELNNTNWNHETKSVTPMSLTAKLYDWGLVSTLDSINYNYMIDTLIDDSTRNKESFISEDYRVDSDFSIWDSTQNLKTYDGNTGLQVLSNRLVYPRVDFTNYNDFVTQPNYTSISNTRYYIRRFETNGLKVSNGIIKLSDYYVTEDDLLYGRIKFEVCINEVGETKNWFDLNKQYDGGILLDGSGCRIDSNDYALENGIISSDSIRFTLGYGGASNFIYLKISFNTSLNRYIGGIELLGSYWT